MNGLKTKVNNVMHPDCPKCSQKMKLVIYGEVLREPNQSDDWVHSNGIKGNKKGMSMSALNVTLQRSMLKDTTQLFNICG